MRRLCLPLFCVLLLSACSGAGQEAAMGTWVSASGGGAIPPSERSDAPAVHGETLDGDPLTLADLDGVVVVNFWASWCGPCAREAPHLREIHERYADRGVHVVGVNVKDRRANARSFERDFSIAYPSWYDESAAIAASFGGIGPAALPSTILLDAEHRVAVRLFGAVTAPQLSRHVDALLAERAVSAARLAAGRS